MIANVSTFLTLALVASFATARPTPMISGEAEVEARGFKTFAEDAGHDAEKALGVASTVAGVVKPILGALERKELHERSFKSFAEEAGHDIGEAASVVGTVAKGAALLGEEAKRKRGFKSFVKEAGHDIGEAASVVGTVAKGAALLGEEAKRRRSAVGTIIKDGAKELGKAAGSSAAKTLFNDVESHFGGGSGTDAPQTDSQGGDTKRRRSAVSTIVKVGAKEIGKAAGSSAAKTLFNDVESHFGGGSSTPPPQTDSQEDNKRRRRGTKTGIDEIKAHFRPLFGGSDAPPQAGSDTSQ